MPSSPLCRHSVAQIKICTPRRFSRRNASQMRRVLRFFEKIIRASSYSNCVYCCVSRLFTRKQCNTGTKECGIVSHAMTTTQDARPARHWRSRKKREAKKERERCPPFPTRNDPSEISIARIPGGSDPFFIRFLEKERAVIDTITTRISGGKKLVAS